VQLQDEHVTLEIHAPDDGRNYDEMANYLKYLEDVLNKRIAAAMTEAKDKGAIARSKGRIPQMMVCVYVACAHA